MEAGKRVFCFVFTFLLSSRGQQDVWFWFSYIFMVVVCFLGEEGEGEWQVVAVDAGGLSW